MTQCHREGIRMKSPLSCGPGILLILLVSQAGRGETAAIPWQPVPDARQPATPLTAVLSLPDGKGPFPAVIVLHGCDGIRAQETGWASRLNSWGYAALVVDSFKPGDA